MGAIFCGLGFIAIGVFFVAMGAMKEQEKAPAGYPPGWIVSDVTIMVNMHNPDRKGYTIRHFPEHRHEPWVVYFEGARIGSAQTLQGADSIAKGHMGRAA